LIGLTNGNGGSNSWGHRIGTIARLVGGHGDGTGTDDFQAVKVSVSISIELSNYRGIKLSPVETKIVDLSVEVSRSIGSNVQVIIIVRVNRSGSRNLKVAGAIDIDLGISGISIGRDGLRPGDASSHRHVQVLRAGY
jgi:hypothetical protein